MKIKEMLGSIPLRVEVAADLDQEITGGYVGDLLSHVMAQAKTGNLWVTIQAHQNIVAVATLLDLSGIIIASGLEPTARLLEKAEKEGINIFSSSENSYQLVKKLSKLGI